MTLQQLIQKFEDVKAAETKRTTEQILLQVLPSSIALLKAKARIPQEFWGTTFFSRNDSWSYTAMRLRTCEACDMWDLQDVDGTELRQAFPELEVIDVDLIFPHVHPNCRCICVRNKGGWPGIPLTLIMDYQSDRTNLLHEGSIFYNKPPASEDEAMSDLYDYWDGVFGQ